MLASQSGNIKEVEALLSCNALVDLQNSVSTVYLVCMVVDQRILEFPILFLLQNGCTALMVASMKGDVDIVEVLVGRHAQVNMQNSVRSIVELGSPSAEGFFMYVSE